MGSEDGRRDELALRELSQGEGDCISTTRKLTFCSLPYCYSFDEVHFGKVSFAISILSALSLSLLSSPRPHLTSPHTTSPSFPSLLSSQPVRLLLHPPRILLRRPPSSLQDAPRSRRLPLRLRRTVRLREYRRQVLRPRTRSRRSLRRDEEHAGCVWELDGGSGVLDHEGEWISGAGRCVLGWVDSLW